MTTITFPEEEDLSFVESFSAIYSRGCTEKPFGDITAEEYFQYAKTARKRDDKAGLVDALSNAKRCFHYQIDKLLYRYGLYEMSKNTGFSEKTQWLSELNIIPATLLRIFNKERNFMEHEYLSPDKETVDGAIDLCDLLFLATERFLHKTPEKIRIKFKNDDRDLVMALKAGTNKISFFQIEGTPLRKLPDGTYYVGQVYDFPDFEKPVEGIKIISLDNMNVPIQKNNKNKWFPLLKIFAYEARKMD